MKTSSLNFPGFPIAPRKLKVFPLLVLALSTLWSPPAARAFTIADRELAWNAWNNAFYYTLANPNRAFYRDKEGSGTPTWFWQFAEEIEIALDRRDVYRVNLLCAGFTAQHGTDWSNNGWNDDLMWASIAFSRAYQLTGNTNYRTWAKNGFDVANNRGWDTAGGGGFFQNTARNSKPSITDGTGAIAAYLIYQTTGDSSYLTRAQTIKNWEKANCYEPATGAVREGPPLDPIYYSYDSGTFAAACWYLGDTATAAKAGDWVKNHWGVEMQHFGTGVDAGGFNGICIRWLAKAGYDVSFLRAVANNAWGRRNSRGLTSCYWYDRTSETDALYSFDCGSMVAALLCVPASPVNGQVYQLEPQCAPGKRLDVDNGSSADNTNVKIYTANGNNAQKWKLIAVDELAGIYSLEPQCAIGKRLDVNNGGSADGTNVKIYTSSNNNAQKWKFLAVDDTNGIYSLEPQCAIGKRLDVAGGLSADNTNVQIYTANPTNAQKWKLLP